MKSAVLIVVVLSLLSVAGGAVAPGVCVNLQAMLSAIIAFMSDPQPDLIIGPGGLIDGSLVCP